MSFEGRTTEPSQVPSVWVVPARDLARLMRAYQTRKVVSRAAVWAEGERFRDAWQLLLGRPGAAAAPG